MFTLDTLSIAYQRIAIFNSESPVITKLIDKMVEVAKLCKENKIEFNLIFIDLLSKVQERLVTSTNDCFLFRDNYVTLNNEINLTLEKAINNL